MIPRILMAGLALSLAGCGTVSGWFNSGPPQPKPAELVAFKQAVSLAEAWKAETAEIATARVWPVLMGEDIIAAGGSRVVRVAVPNGTVRWRSDIDFRVMAGAGAGDGLALLGGNKGEVVALDAATGQSRWQTRLSSEVVGAPLVSGEQVVVRTGDGRIQGLAAADGNRLWLYSRILPALSLRGAVGMTLADGTLYAGFPGGKLVALNPANGAQLWEATVALPRGATELERVADVMGAPVVDARQVCAVTYRGRLACFDRVTGALLWARETSSHAGLAMDTHNIYITDDQDAIVAHDKASGRAVWRQDKLARRQVTAPLALGAWVVVADGEGYVHVLSAEDGSFVGRAKLDSPVRTAPVDIGPGFAVQTIKGTVIAFRLQ